jgi:hypothetical protein
MTSQTKRFIDVVDLLAFCFECKCGSTVVTPISDYREMPVTCSNCGHQFADLANSAATQEVFENVITALQRAQQTAEGRGFRFSFEIKDDAE